MIERHQRIGINGMYSIESSLTPDLWAVCQSVKNTVEKAGGRAYLVGGCVRDACLHLPVYDVDIEVFGLNVDVLENILSEEHKVVQVGKTFGVLKLRDHRVDVSVPRREKKVNVGHCGFRIDCDPNLSVKEAAARRDFTVNALYFDLKERKLLDPHGGLEDLKNKILRHTSKKFVEDPLRVLRGMQFIARFGFKPDPATVELCRTMDAEGLSRERIFEEWKKLILLGQQPSLGLEFLKQCGWTRFFPELEKLIDCQQDLERHPEGDVYTHTALTLDYFAQHRTGDPTEDLIVGLALLCHDFGKPATTCARDGKIVSYHHADAGVQPTRAFLGQLTRQETLVEAVVALVGEHMRPRAFYVKNATDGDVRRLACRVRIDRLLRVAAADTAGRTLTNFDFRANEWLHARAEKLGVLTSAPHAIVQGRHLVELGHQPNQKFSKILQQCFDAQLNGVFADTDGGIAYLKTLL